MDTVTGQSGNNDNPYGDGKRPPYSLYQSTDGRWGLEDGDGRKLLAIFDRIDEHRFSRVPWEVVTFDEREGFGIVSWFDPCEVWFNFTFDNPAYPGEFAGYLWMRPEREINEYSETLYALIPERSHWLIDNILRVRETDELEDEDLHTAVDAMLCRRPEMVDPSETNPLLDPVMRDDSVAADIKIALWREKVRLDSMIRLYREGRPD